MALVATEEEVPREGQEAPEVNQTPGGNTPGGEVAYLQVGGDPSSNR